MKFFFGLMITLLVTTFSVYGQDTTYQYFNKNWEKCAKDTAFYYGKIWQENNLWKRKDYWLKTNIVQMDGSYKENTCKTRQGTFNWYYENGGLKTTTLFDDGKTKSSDYFYESGKKQAQIIYNEKESEQKGWTENGEEIPGYVVEKEAKFPGGLVAWKKYLERNLIADIASGSKPGNYTVTIQFLVDKEGNISDAHPTEVPKNCKLCATEAMRVIEQGPKWEPAVQNNLPVIYRQVQSITFQVNKE